MLKEALVNMMQLIASQQKQLSELSVEVGALTAILRTQDPGLRAELEHQIAIQRAKNQPYLEQTQRTHELVQQILARMTPVI